MKKAFPPLRCALLAAICVSGPALAQQSSPAEAAPAADGGLFAAQVMDDKALQAIAGREDVNQHSQAEQAAGVANNSVGDNVRTGDAQISGNAFQNMSGLSILNVNTGNNVAINAAMNVNISISPGG